MLCLCGHPAAAHTVECDEPGCPCLGFAPVLNERMRIVYVNAAGEEVPYSPGPDDICDAIEGHAAQAEHNRSGEPTVPWADAEAELNLAPVAEGPYFGIDVSESPDVSAVVLFNTETGEFVATNGAHGFFDFPAYAVQGGGLIGDPLKDITARQTNTIADLSKKEWKP